MGNINTHLKLKKLKKSKYNKSTPKPLRQWWPVEQSSEEQSSPKQLPSDREGEEQSSDEQSSPKQLPSDREGGGNEEEEKKEPIQYLSNNVDDIDRQHAFNFAKSHLFQSDFSSP